MIDIVPVAGLQPDGVERPQITRAQLIAIIRLQLERWMGEIDATLKTIGFTGPGCRQVVLSGGGAELKGMADYAQGALGRSVRIGRPRGLAGLPEAHSGPAFATLAGLAQFAAAAPVDLRQIVPSQQTVHRVSASGMVQKLIAAFRQGY
jgi:cell division protein FtsA